VIFANEDCNKFQKTKFQKEKSVEDMVTIELSGTGHTNIGERRTTFVKAYGIKVRCY